MAQTQLPQDSMERMLEQGAGQDPQNNPLLKQQGQGASGGATGSISSAVKAAISIGDPNAWARELYGLPPEPIVSTEKKDDKNHTPLDMNKAGSKDKTVTPEQRKFFKKYQDEYEQFLDQKKKQAEDKKKQEEEEERKRKEEAQKKKEEEQNQDSGGQGKQKQKLGQPRRKATTEQHPETKAGGAK
jgi:hypothetical protein